MNDEALIGVRGVQAGVQTVPVFFKICDLASSQPSFLRYSLHRRAFIKKMFISIIIKINLNISDECYIMFI